MTSSAGRERGIKGALRRGFTLLEVLAAFAVLVTGLTLIAAAFTRHLHAIRLLADSITAYRIADQTLQREFLKRRERIEIEASPLPPGFTPLIRQEQATLRVPPEQEVVMDRIRAQVTWANRGQSRSSEVVSGVIPRGAESP